MPSTYLTTFVRLSDDDEPEEETDVEKYVGTIDENGFLQIDGIPVFNT